MKYYMILAYNSNMRMRRWTHETTWSIKHYGNSGNNDADDDDDDYYYNIVNKDKWSLYLCGLSKYGESPSRR